MACSARRTHYGKKEERGPPSCTKRGLRLPTLQMVRQLRMADHDGCATVAMRLGSGNNRTGRSVAVGPKLGSRTTKTRSRRGGKVSALLRVVPHNHAFSLSRSHRPLNQKLISSVLILPPPHTSLPFGVAKNRKHHHLRSTRLSLHLRHLHKHPCPHHLASRHHNSYLSLRAHSPPPSRYLH